jgi:hypothetical protein
MYRNASFLFLVFSAGTLWAQWPLRQAEAEKVNRFFDSGFQGDELKCDVRVLKPFLDFTFRFETGFIVTCPMKQFEGKETPLVFYLRIRSASAPPVLLGDLLRVPALPAQFSSKVDMARFKGSAEFSGVFATGEGLYNVEFLIADGRRRHFVKRWVTKAATHGSESKAPLALKPGIAVSAAIPPWRELPEAKDSGSRVTVLLNAAPLNPRALRLRAWDRTFLLDSLSSLVQHLPTNSIRLVAFNLDQQRLIFEQDNFDRVGFRKLAQALSDLELGTVSYRNLQNRSGAFELLAKLINQETAHPGKQSASAVLFLGPNLHIETKIPREMLSGCEGGNPPVFYFEYYPRYGDGDFPDSIHHLTNACNGTVFKLHSPADFGSAITKLQKKLQLNREQPSPDRNVPSASANR